MTSSPIAIAKALHAALEAGKHGDDLRHHFTPDATTTEHPNLVRPAGGTRSLDQMLADSAAGARLLAEQRYEVRSAVEVGELAILRLTWTGTIARAIGPYRAGQVLEAHIAQFVETRDGLVASIETFDCYEPLS